MTDAIDDFRVLMQRVRSGADDAAWEVVERYGDAIRRAVRRTLHARLRSKFDSLDFVQIVWKSFFQAKEKTERFNTPEELAAFLAAMAHNKVAMEVRRRLQTEKYNVGRERSLDDGEYGMAIEKFNRDPAPIDVAIAREQWNRILHNQPTHYRRIVQLRLQGAPIRRLQRRCVLMSPRFDGFSSVFSKELQHEGTPRHSAVPIYSSASVQAERARGEPIGF